MALWNNVLGKALRELISETLDRTLGTRTARQQRREQSPGRPRPAPRRQQPPLAEEYPGDFTGRVEMVYAPMPGDLPDPGEVVWTWVPYEEDHRKGKDRPVLLIGRSGEWLLGLPLTSRDHDRDAASEARQGRYWVDIGTGAWDRQRRPSEARVDRIIRVHPDKVRRIGDQVSERVFAEVAAGVRAHRKL